jgi:hypothetical protein
VDVGILLIFQNYLGRGRDEDMVRAETRVAELAEPLGFDKGRWASTRYGPSSTTSRTTRPAPTTCSS